MAVARAGYQLEGGKTYGSDLQAKENCGSIFTGYVKSYRLAHCLRRQTFFSAQSDDRRAVSFRFGYNITYQLLGLREHQHHRGAWARIWRGHRRSSQ